MPKDASVYKRPGRTCWYISYTCPVTCKRLHVTTRFKVTDPTGEKRAYRLAQEKSHEAAIYRGGSKVEHFDSWALNYIQTRYARQPLTAIRYRAAWDSIHMFLVRHNLRHPEGIHYNDIIKFIPWRITQKRACGKPITRNTAITELKVFGLLCREAVRRGYAKSNPCEKLQLRRDPPKAKSEITDKQIALIRDILREQEGDKEITERWMTICFEIALHHGCRLSETSVPMTSVNLQHGTITFSAKGKNGVAKVYTNRIHPAIRPLLEKLHAAGAAYTCSLPMMAAKKWHTLFQKKEELKPLSFHCTRVTVITRFARAGVPMAQAMAYVGHSSEAVHRIYQKLKAEDLTSCQVALSYADTPASA